MDRLSSENLNEERNSLTFNATRNSRPRQSDRSPRAVAVQFDFHGSSIQRSPVGNYMHVRETNKSR